MKINTLRLENFQGIKSATFDFRGQSASIYGDNATGKTTVFNAVTWLLFGCPSTGAKGYTPKTDGPDGELHHLDHAAEAQFIMDSGRMATFRKVFHENYKKKRGSATEEFSGHSVDFFIDGVPVKEKDYTSALLDFCGGAEKMKMLTMPLYFPEGMSWEARRKILLEVCGDVTDAEVIASSDELKELPACLLMPGTADQYYTVDEYRKIAAAQKTDINKQLRDIPGRIDEAQRAIPEETIDVTAIDTRLAALQTKQDGLMEQRAALLSGGTAAAEARKRTAAAEAALAEARSAYAKKAAEANQSIYRDLADIQATIIKVQGEQELCVREAEKARQQAEQMTQRREELLREYNSVRAEVWDESQAVCPTCHRELPAGDIARMREDFNACKSARLQAINERGKREANKQMIAELLLKVDDYEAEAKMAAEDLQQILGEKSDFESRIQTAIPFEEIEAFSSLSAVVAKCRAAEGEAGKSTAAELEALNAQIEAVRAESHELQQQRGRAEQAEIQRKRIADLQDQEKALSARYEELEKGLYLCEQFIKAKVGMLTDRINSKFQSVRFRLFVEQVNGGLKDDCEVLVPGETGAMVPFRDANNAARINAGLEIIGALSAHWGLTMPVFIDNAEGVQKIPDQHTQLIQLVVPASWDKLGAVAQSALIRAWGGEKQAREQYETPNKKLRLELDNPPDETRAA